MSQNPAGARSGPLTVERPRDSTERVPHQPSEPAVVHLSAAGTSLVVDCTGDGLPRIVHWGASLGDLDSDELAALVRAAVPPVTGNTLDEPVPVAILPEHARGWAGHPGVVGSRAGRAWSPLFLVSEKHCDRNPRGGGRLRVTAQDPTAALSLALQVELSPDGLVRLQGTVRNQHPEEPYQLDGVALTLPVPREAEEILDLTGRHCRERSPQRQPFNVGARVREGRRGRTGTDASLVLAAGARDFGFREGEVWALHVGWSGNHRTYAERLPSGASLIGGGELLLPGEVQLAPGESYESPWVYGSWGHGLDAVSHRFHDWLRARDHHPRSPRPVVLNTWEAVYFDHDLPTLLALAERAAEVGVERFVLDDGWFQGRRDDTRGLGDWRVDPDIWPQGLHPLVDHVRALGMQFGLWVEPEMVNPDSDLVRAHPDWILATEGRRPPLARSQQVLDLANPDAYERILSSLNALLSEYDIAFLKWDHNRDLVDAGHDAEGVPGVRAQTLAVYRMLDQLRAAHPGLEIESCSSGGGRVDLGILERTDRIWGSDTNDPLERQAIQRWTGLLLPPELIGCHVGGPVSHTTGRSHRLAFRAGTALFGHFGIEWDLTRAAADELAELAEWVALHKRLRPLLHAGTVIRPDHPDPALLVHGVVAADRSEAVYAFCSVATGVTAPPGRVRLPGLDSDRVYRVRPLPPGAQPAAGHRQAPPPWIADGGTTLTGAALGAAGLQAPNMHPDSLILLHLQSVGAINAGAP